ncbi:hypothetical protein Nepgr_014231 [Nepenthes gracilis]|uniref:Protein BIG GRAIN 1-like B n=1 Tax=Nepenthes gracilis TaxID=150966 RepID=A0AAD3XQ83_NEPGR|nr:hypothetical protein Nepgr_014231 [Nepenthes gracilis]
MYKWEKSTPQDRYNKQIPGNPSFSSTLLHEIYRSIEAEQGQDLCFYGSKHRNGALEEEEMSSFRRACLAEKWMEKNVNGKAIVSQGQRRRRQSSFLEGLEVKIRPCEIAIPFSNSSSSSDSSFGGFSSSETESYSGGSKPRASCFAPPRYKPVKTSIPAREARSSHTQYRGHKESDLFEDYGCQSRENSMSDHTISKSKSKLLNISSNLKNLKQPISPGMRLASFMNSLFTKESSKKKNRSVNFKEGCGFKERNFKSEEAPTCSSARSFSSSCLMGKSNSPSSGQNLQNGMKRSVRFNPVSVIVGEDSHPLAHKGLYKEDEVSQISKTTSTAKLGRMLSKRYEEFRKLKGIEKERELEDIALGLANGYRIEKDNDGLVRNASDAVKGDYEDDLNENDNDDFDGLSCSSSDLFELDHLSLFGNEELPVYETTRLPKDR